MTHAPAVSACLLGTFIMCQHGAFRHFLESFASVQCVKARIIGPMQMVQKIEPNKSTPSSWERYGGL